MEKINHYNFNELLKASKRVKADAAAGEDKTMVVFVPICTECGHVFMKLDRVRGVWKERQMQIAKKKIKPERCPECGKEIKGCCIQWEYQQEGEKTMIKIEAKIDKGNNQTEVSIEQEGSAVDIFAEVGGIIMALVKDVVQRVSETGEVIIGHTSMPLREETVDAMAQMMQEGFREGVNQLIEQGILRKDYGEV